jgi:ABC-type sugar transport system substrate-binding protein/DNA-binding CsgD family transcriptional regulator
MDTTNKQDVRGQLSERELAILRLMADGLSNQEIADRLFLALTTIKWYIRQINDKLDTHTRTQTVARAHQLKLVGDSDTARVKVVEEHEPPENPYKGLHAFQEADAADFFGREALVRRLIERLNEQSQFARFLAVIGPSGSGKSSVVNAGLIPALRRGALHGSENWLIVEILPSAHPLEELEVALLRLATNPPLSLLAQLREDERGLLRAVRRTLPGDNSVLVLVIDQFEEVFTLVDNPNERQQFLDLLYAAATDARSPLRIVITLRADFYDRPLLYTGFGELMHQRAEVVLPLTAEELEQAISRPAAQVGVMVEPGLVTTMAAEVNQQPGALPLLQYALTELFDYCQGNTLTLEAYHAIGGTLGALARRADALYDKLNDTGQEAARQIFLRLVTLGEGVEDTRRRVEQAELRSVGDYPGTIEEIVQTFAAYRLLTLDYDPATHSPTVELAHEAIIREWQRLRVWLDESRADVRMQRLLAAATNEWHSAGSDSGFLLTGSRLAQFEDWSTGAGVALTTAERTYLDASIAERQRQSEIERERQAREARLERRSRTFLRTLVVVLLLATLGAFGLTTVALRNEAEARSLALASAAQLALNEGNIEQAVQQANAALQIGDNPLAHRVLDLAAYAPRSARIFQETSNFIPGALAIQDNELTFVMIAPFGRTFGPFGASIVSGMEDACELLNASCQWVTEPGGGEPNPENAPLLWDEALALNPDGIGTTMWEADRIRSKVEQASEKGIPVVAFNIARSSADATPLPAILYIGSDEYISGQSNARRVFAEARADGVTIRRGVCPNQRSGDTPTESPMIIRCAGVESVFVEAGVPLDHIFITDGEWETAAGQLADYFAQNPDTNAIFMLGPGPAASLNRYFKQAGLSPRQLYATSHDTSPEIFQMIRDGYLLQTIDQQQYMQGYQTIMSLYLYRQYGIRPSGFINTSSIVDRTNVDYVDQLVELGYR